MTIQVRTKAGVSYSPPAWTHASWFHGIIVLLAGTLASLLAGLIDMLHSGAIPLSPNYAIFGTIAAAVLTAVLVKLRDWLQVQQSPAPAPVVAPPVVPASFPPPPPPPPA